MKAIHITIICVLAVTCRGMAYDLPEVIGNIEMGSNYPTDFCNIGDQNGDNRDDFIIPDYNENRLEIYYGGDNMGEEIGYIIEPQQENEVVRSKINYLGNILPDRAPFFVNLSSVRIEPTYLLLNIFEGGDNLDDNPEFTYWSIYQHNEVGINDGYATRPTDVNADGFNDLIAILKGDSLGKVFIFYGGEEFDTIPDWEITVNTPWRIMGGAKYSSGLDVNGDGYHDIYLRTKLPTEQRNVDRYWYSLYLGGNPMDTIPVFTFREDHFEGEFVNRKMEYGFTMLPDVNGDGYDDWGNYWFEFSEDYTDDGFCIFFGSEEPDMEPDLELEGHRRLLIQEGDITGGDFNGDGVGDIATGLWASTVPRGEVMIHFGSAWMDGEADIYIDSEYDYEGEYFPLGSHIGAVGDYNGDEVDDFVAISERPGRQTPRAIVFAGNRDWRVSVDNKPVPEEFVLSLNADPNPFNSSVTITYETVQSSFVRLAVYDIRGRLVEELENRRIIKGYHSLTWTHNISGIYFILLETGSTRVIKKIVCVP
ncbi:T9SS type A sorting domain-containing protein [bacterium]|nr:T9SS type A sorting domain-containing protein [bacterium]